MARRQRNKRSVRLIEVGAEIQAAADEPLENNCGTTEFGTAPFGEGEPDGGSPLSGGSPSSLLDPPDSITELLAQIREKKVIGVLCSEGIIGTNIRAAGFPPHSRSPSRWLPPHLTSKRVP
ncbi:unnamed protein product [Heligmosomoides polygyrus]|uniref:Uncharacterized protein n=1 Tax=Heligmosomoides polygyrus TaxID=6339 RepID=A0A183FG38_HELPZ|nr:unnamed protein product [Heligmosomoides polygyrus]